MPANILVVDDELDLQELMQRKFRREIRHGEFSFEFADDGKAALEKIRNGPEVDLVIGDIDMPGMDGLTLLEHLSDFDDKLKTIIISAYGDMDNIRSAMNRGAFDFVTKPIDFQDLLITVKKTLDQLDILKEAFEQRLAAERARSNLSRYFAPNVVQQLADRDEPFGPPREQNLVTLFSDIRGFTTLSEAKSAAEVMEMLREFLGRMEAVIFEHGGTLEKFIGDEVMAIFGTPDTGPKDATNAIACARKMLAELARWNEQRVADGRREISVGVGIHYGPAVLGDIGSERSMEFAVIGDTVNTASRLQGMTRTLNSDLVVSQELIDKVREEACENAAAVLENLVEAGEQEVKGREGKVRVYALRIG